MVQQDGNLVGAVYYDLPSRRERNEILSSLISCWNRLRGNTARKPDSRSQSVLEDHSVGKFAYVLMGPGSDRTPESWVFPDRG